MGIIFIFKKQQKKNKTKTNKHYIISIFGGNHHFDKDETASLRVNNAKKHTPTHQ